MTILVAQAGIASTVGWYAVAAVVVIAIVAIVLVVARQSGVPVPAWFTTILWILGAAIFAILAIKILLSLV